MDSHKIHPVVACDIMDTIIVTCRTDNYNGSVEMIPFILYVTGTC